MKTGICNPYTVNYEKLIIQLNKNPPNNLKTLQENIRYLLNANEKETNKIIEIITPLNNNIAKIALRKYAFEYYDELIT
jgi:hypothetical protein